jgi:hemolysin activation/secretion protein
LRVVVPEQSLLAGVLSLRYIPGHISAVQDKDMPGWWRTSLPSGPGAIVQQRDLDQALENIRRLGGQADATLQSVWITPEWIAPVIGSLTRG